MFENVTKEGNFFQSATGDYGFRRLGAGESTSEFCRAVQVLQDAVITTTTSVGDALTSETVIAGMTIIGKFESVSVTSGVVLAMKAS